MNRRKTTFRRLVMLSMAGMLSIAADAKDVLVADYGVAGDGMTMNTKALQRAIDDCSVTGGGRVVFSPGRYLTGSIELRSGVMLYLPHGAELQGSTRYTSDYPHRALIFADNVEHAGIMGEGVINGSGAHPDVIAQGFQVNDGKRPNLVFFRDCRQMRVTDVTLKDAGSWTLRLFRVDGVTIDRVNLRALAQGNNDGIDVDAKNVIISNCNIEVEDDGICLKSDDKNFMPENIVVTNCVIASNCNPIKFGTASAAGFRNVNISNCAIRRTSEAHIFNWPREYRQIADGTLTGLAGIAIESADGGVIEHVNIQNITMEGVITPIFICLNHRKGTTGEIRDIYINNVSARAEGVIPCLITGSPKTKVKDIMLRDIRVEHEGGEEPYDKRLPESNGYPENRMFGHRNPASGLYVRHAERVRVDNMVMSVRRKDYRPAVVLDDVDGFTGTEIRSTDDATVVCKLQGDCKNVLVNGKRK